MVRSYAIAMKRLGAGAVAVLGMSWLVGCASSCPPQTAVVQLRGAKPQLADALALTRTVLTQKEADYRPGTELRVVHGDVYPINATNLAWNWEQAWMLCVAWARPDGAMQRRGVAMRVGPDGLPFPVSTINWRDYAGQTC